MPYFDTSVINQFWLLKMAVVPEDSEVTLLIHAFRYAKYKEYLDDSNKMKKSTRRKVAKLVFRSRDEDLLYRKKDGEKVGKTKQESLAYDIMFI